MITKDIKLDKIQSLLPTRSGVQGAFKLTNPLLSDASVCFLFLAATREHKW